MSRITKDQVASKVEAGAKAHADCTRNICGMLHNGNGELLYVCSRV